MRILHRIKYVFSPHKQFILQLEDILGYIPRHLPYYKQALSHRSTPNDMRDNNERLEFLGDAILGAVVAEYLFKKYPNQSEGYLTELRSKLVRRETMNSLAMRMGINKLMAYNQGDHGLTRSHIFGNALEALIGAVYLDRGYEKTKKFIIHQIIRLYINLDTLDASHSNYKNQFLSWAQKHNHTVAFETITEKNEGSRRLFTVGILVDGELFERGNGYNKKDAGQVASQKALEKVQNLKNAPFISSKKVTPIQPQHPETEIPESKNEHHQLTKDATEIRIENSTFVAPFITLEDDITDAPIPAIKVALEQLEDTIVMSEQDSSLPTTSQEIENELQNSSNPPISIIADAPTQIQNTEPTLQETHQAIAYDGENIPESNHFPFFKADKHLPEQDMEKETAD